MVCPKCGSPESGDERRCSNCGAELERRVEGLDQKSEGLRQMTQKLKAVEEEGRTFPPGEVIADRFEIDEYVEAGPFGEVYRARDEIIETDVALKMFDADVVRTPPEREAFLDATRAARAMTQKNVVRVHDSGVHDGHPWVSMQYLEGLTLEKALQLREKKGERFTLEELEPIVTQITLALQHIGREFPNGNLKPTNVFFLPDLLKVTDGYILSAVPGKIFTGRQSESEYVAPELQTSADNADVRCDVYSLGRIIGEMYFGTDYAPGEWSAPDAESVAVDALCQRATAFDPAERYPTVEALSEDFSTLVDTGQLLDRGSALSATNSDVTVDEESMASDATSPAAAPGPNGAFPEEEVATRDYERSDPGPGPAGPTNEVDRQNHPAPESHPAGELPPEPASPENPPSDGISGGSPAATARPGQGTSSHEDEERGFEPLHIGGYVVALGILIGLIIWLLPRQANRDEVVISDDESAAASGADEARGAAAGGAGPGEEVLAAMFREVSEANQTAMEAARREAAGSASGEDSEGRASAGAAGRGAAERGAEGGVPETRSEERGAAPSAAVPDCPSSMVLVGEGEGAYCIDRYEYPGAGEQPKNNVTWFEAKSTCERQGKRLCTLSEFRRACGASYPWGEAWDATKCNTQDRSGFARSLAAAGSFEQCRSPSGAYDMVGNVLEWVREKKIAGGAFDSGSEVASCRYASAKAPRSTAPTVGFRCCASPN